MQKAHIDEQLEILVYCENCRECDACLCAALDTCLLNMGLHAQVKRFTQTLDRAVAGIPLTPALVINGRLVAMGSDLGCETIGMLLQLCMRTGTSMQAPEAQDN